MPKACFFSTVPEHLLRAENYSMLDLRILRELGYDVSIASAFRDIPLDCDLYFSWWASGSFIPLLKALACRRPIITIAGGNEATLCIDSVSRRPIGYLASAWYKQLATRITLLLSTQVVFVSGFMAPFVRQLGARRAMLIYNAVDTGAFRAAPTKPLYITSIIRLSKSSCVVKRASVLIRAAAIVIREFPEQKFAIIGRKGDAFSEIEKLVEELNIAQNIIFTGEIPNDQLVAWYQKCLLYVQISDIETFGVAIAEAMSCEVPVLVSRRGAIPEVVGPDGLFVDHNSVDSVAQGMLSFLRLDEGRRKAIGVRLRDRVERKFSFERRKAAISEVIANLVSPDCKII